MERSFGLLIAIGVICGVFITYVNYRQINTPEDKTHDWEIRDLISENVYVSDKEPRRNGYITFRDKYSDKEVRLFTYEILEIDETIVKK